MPRGEQGPEDAATAGAQLQDRAVCLRCEGQPEREVEGASLLVGDGVEEGGITPVFRVSAGGGYSPSILTRISFITSEVPPPTVRSRMSRQARPTGYSVV